MLLLDQEGIIASKKEISWSYSILKKEKEKEKEAHDLRVV